jgi:hypothetical protein
VGRLAGMALTGEISSTFVFLTRTSQEKYSIE